MPDLLSSTSTTEAPNAAVRSPHFSGHRTFHRRVAVSSGRGLVPHQPLLQRKPPKPDVVNPPVPLNTSFSAGGAKRSLPLGCVPTTKPNPISGPGGATTTGPDAPPPPPPQLSVKTCGGGRREGGGGIGSLAGGGGGGCAQPTTITCIPQGGVWGHGGIEVCMR